jgi:hypothetical protein
LFSKTLPPYYLGGVHKRDAPYQRVVNLKASTYEPGKRACLGRLGAGKKEYASPPRHCRLTGHCPLTSRGLAQTWRHLVVTPCTSPASADMTLIILRVADLAAASLDGHFEYPTEIHHP